NRQFTLHPHIFFLVLTLTGGGACHRRSFLSRSFLRQGDSGGGSFGMRRWVREIVGDFGGFEVLRLKVKDGGGA
ncbi:hypothetical protein L195_g044080, partial [Trifolium pratense]